MESDRYAIEAKSDNPSTGQQLQEMLRTLLVNRFALKFHYESQQVDGFVLSLAQNKPKFKDATGHEENPGVGFKPGPERGQQIITSTNVAFSQFVKQATEVVLRSLLHGPVVDKTGLLGNYDFILGPFLAREDPSFSGPTVFEAFRELGLRLDPQKVNVDVFVIDHVEKPVLN